MKTVGNDRQKTPPFSLSHFFHRKQKWYDIFENENDAGIPVISKTEIYGREHIDNCRNLSKQYLKNNKHIKQ